ncbi:MAG: hypothetical protein ABL860_04415 [Candidatus Nitrotoga sp.]
MANNLNAGDASTYMFADNVHPTPYSYSLFVEHVLRQMAGKGWYNNCL